MVDDESSMREFLGICLKRSGHQVTAAASLAAAQAALAATEFDLVITDLRLGGGTDGLMVLDAVKQRAPETQVVVITAYATADTALSAMKRGAYDYLTKPFKIDEITVVIERALEKRRLVRENATLRDELHSRVRLDRLLGKSQAMQRVFDLVRKVAQSRTTVLLTGESGTGKELVARAIHNEGSRAQKPFLAVNCGAIPDAILESELFGHVKGAFTGAAVDKVGLFESATAGTLLLDEVGELPAQLQVKLLRALQERKIKPVGGVHEREVDVRVIAATHRDLEAEVGRGAFRQDLYYRLNVIEIRLPPLFQRKEDIPLLVDHFLRKFAAEQGRKAPLIEPRTLAALVDYDYPGNVRELENLIERAMTLDAGPVLARDALPSLLPQRPQRVASSGGSRASGTWAAATRGSPTPMATPAASSSAPPPSQAKPGPPTPLATPAVPSSGPQPITVPIPRLANVPPAAAPPATAAPPPEPELPEIDLPPEGIDLEQVMGDYERELLNAALRRTGGVRKEAARLLGVTFRSLRYRLAKLGIDPDAASDDPGSEDPPADPRRQITQPPTK